MGEQPRGFWAAAAADPGRVAVIDPAGRSWSAGEVLAGANRMVHALRARGLQPGDPVATLLPNRVEAIETLMAVFQGGWNYVPLNSNLTASEVAYILGDAGAKVLIADERFAEVEGALLAHPAVGDVAVFGIPDDEWGEQVKAVVEPSVGPVAGDALAEDVLAEDLLAHCRTVLAPYKCPRSIDFTDALPRDPNGKLYKRRLRDPYWDGRERSV